MSEALGKGPYIQTYTGRQFFLLDPKAEDFRLEDFAHALARVCRYTGHGEFYSVAQHCILASRMAEKFYYGQDPLLPCRMLVHDLSEAYLNDISSPLKSLLPDYRRLEAKMEETIELALGVKFVGIPLVKEIDMRMLVTERPIVFNDAVPLWVQTTSKHERFTCPFAAGTAGEVGWNHMWKPWPPERAEREYLARFQQLFDSRGWTPKAVKSAG